MQQRSATAEARGQAAEAGPVRSTPLLLGGSLALAGLCALPLADGGYSGAGYLVMLIILPLALALGWPLARSRPLAAQGVLLAYLCAGVALPWMAQQGRELWCWVLPLPLGWCAAWVLLTSLPERRAWLLPGLTLAAAGTAVWGIVLWALSGSPATRLTANFGLPNAYAGYLLLAWPLAGLAVLSTPARGLRRACGAALACLLFALVFTYSRAAWCCLALQLAAVAVWLLLTRRRSATPDGPGPAERWPRWLAAAVPLGLLSLFALPSVREVLARVADFGGYSMTGRRRFWEAALAMWRDHPLAGVGPGNFGAFFPQYQRDPWWYSVDPHSWLLQLVSELGVGGLVIAVACLAGTTGWLRRIWRGLPGAEAMLLSAAVVGSLLHAAVDFDYTFGATTGLLGALLAWGSWRATEAAADTAADPPPTGKLQPSQAATRSGTRSLAWVTCALLVAVAAWGVGFTAERYCLDRLRDTPGINPGVRLELLLQAVHSNPLNHATHYRLASLYSQGRSADERKQALAEAERALSLNPRYAPAWALRGLLKGAQAGGDSDLKHALELDPFNYPEHYFYYSTLAPDDATRRQRLLDGLAQIQVTAPVTPEDIRSDWVRLNGMFARWYYELARLAPDEHEATALRQTGARFEAYDEQRKREAQSPDPAAPAAPAQGAAPDRSA